MYTELYNFLLYDPTQILSIQMDLSNYVHDKSSGFGIPEINRYFEQGPMQHGATDRGFLLKPRLLTFLVKMRATTPTEFYTRRKAIIDVLRPAVNNTPAQLRVTLPDASVWKINVFLTKPPVFIRNSALSEDVEFTLIAPDPVWIKHISVTYLQFAQADIGTSKILTYTGGWITSPYPFSIRGPLVHPIIENLTAGTKIDLNYSVIDNKTILIDLRYGYKTILYGTTSLLQYLSSDSDLEGFYLLPNPDATDGNNTIKVSGSGQGSNTLVKLGWTPVNIGL
jgi:hypothetical protein